MVTIKKFLKLFTFFLASIFLVISLTYALIIFNPDNILYVIKKLSKESIIVEYQDIFSNGNFLKPKISIDQIVIKNFENEKILSFDNIEVGIKLYELLLNQNFHLDLFL